MRSPARVSMLTIDRSALRAEEGIAGAGVPTAYDVERQAKQGTHLPLPVSDQAGGRHDEHAPEEPAGQHFPDVQAGHDRLACPRVVGQQKSQGGLLEHLLVHGDALMRERVDQRRFRCEGGIEQMAVGQAMRLGDRRDRFRIGGEIHAWRWGRLLSGGVFYRSGRFIGRYLQLEDAPPGQVVGLRFLVFPAVDGGVGNANEVRELRLGQPPGVPGVFDPPGKIPRQAGRNNRCHIFFD